MIFQAKPAEEMSKEAVNLLFPGSNASELLSMGDSQSSLRMKRKFIADYEGCQELPAYLERKMTKASKSIIPKKPSSQLIAGNNGKQLLEIEGSAPAGPASNSVVQYAQRHQTSSSAISSKYAQQKPQWHAPWKLMRVISGHLGWVRSVCVEPDNQWFATGSSDRTIKIWDLASGRLRLTLTGHIMTVRGLVVSPRHPYLFSAGEDKMVKCWDLETNKVIRHYHGHLSSVYSIALHPTLDLLVTGSRDSSVRVWDMRTRQAVHVLTGHQASVSSVKAQEFEPQVISSSMDSTVRLWDLAAGKTRTVLTHHKKAVRDLAMHPTEFTFSSASAENIKQWKLPNADFMHNFYPHNNSIVNTINVNQDGVMFAGADDGSMAFYDWKTGHRFQHTNTTALPGSLEAEQGILTSAFDKSGMRLITGEADKSIKIWREDPDATEDSHPLSWTPNTASY